MRWPAQLLIICGFSDTADQNFQNPVLNIVTTDTFRNTHPAFVAGKRYHWEVLPLSGVETCVNPAAANLQRFQFSGTQTVGLNFLNAADFSLSISPNPASGSVPFFLILETGMPANMQLEALTATGISVWKGEVKMTAGKTTLQIQSQEWPAGVYLLRVTGNSVSEVRRLLKTN